MDDVVDKGTKRSVRTFFADCPLLKEEKYKSRDGQIERYYRCHYLPNEPGGPLPEVGVAAWHQSATGAARDLIFQVQPASWYGEEMLELVHAARKGTIPDNSHNRMLKKWKGSYARVQVSSSRTSVEGATKRVAVTRENTSETKAADKTARVQVVRTRVERSR